MDLQRHDTTLSPDALLGARVRQRAFTAPAKQTFRVVIGTGVAGGGHESQTEAMLAALADHASPTNNGPSIHAVSAQRVDVLSDKVTKTYRYATTPGWQRMVHGFCNHASNNTPLAYFTRFLTPGPKEDAIAWLAAEPFDLAVSTHPLLVAPLVRVAQRHHARVLVWCPEMGRKNNHAVMTLRPHADYFLFGHELGIHRYLRGFGVPEHRVRWTGFPLRREFYQPRLPKAEHRRALGIEADRQTLLVTAGGEGTGLVRELVEAVSKREGLRGRCQMVIVCGRNEVLRGQLEALSQHMPPGFIRPFGYVSSQVMRDAIGGADIVVGLTCGVTQIMETAIFGRVPFFAVGYISGQEWENLALLEEWGIGRYDLDVEGAARDLEILLRDGGAMEAHTRAIERFRAMHLDAPRRFAHAVTEAASGVWH